MVPALENETPPAPPTPAAARRRIAASRGAPVDRIGRRALNRAALARQHLLARTDADVVAVVEAVVGLNAQQPDDPYLALASRRSGFALDDLTAAVTDRRILRSCLLRGTQRLVSAVDLRWLRPVVGPLLERVQRSVFGRRTAGVDLAVLATDTRALLSGTTLLRPELGRALAAARPGGDATALAWSAQCLVPLVHPAPSGTWGHRGTIPVALAEDALRAALLPPDPRRLVRRYLAAYGPATTADLRSWSGVSGLPEVVTAMAGELRSWRDDDGRVLHDLPEAPRPDADVPAPARLLAGFDELLLAYADRSRLMTDEVRRRVCVPDLVEPTVLVDGAVVGTWTLDVDAVVVTVRPFAPLAPVDVEAVTDEAQRVLALVASDPARGDVRVDRPA